MSYEDHEQSSHLIFNLYVRCTDAEQRWIMLRLIDTPEHVRWDALDSARLVIETSDVFGPAMDFGAKHAEAHRACTRAAARLIDEMIAMRNAP